MSHRQSEPILHHNYNVQQQQQQRSQQYNGLQQQHPLPPPSRLSTQSDHHYSQIDYQAMGVPHPPPITPGNQPPHFAAAQSPYNRRDSFLAAHAGNDVSFTGDGRIPSSQEADRFFYRGNPNESVTSFNDSRLSLGFGRGMTSMPQPPPQTPEAMYETLSHYKSGGNVSNASWTASMVDPAMLHKREPPPLPPKPRLSSSSSAHHPQLRPSVGSEADLPINGYGKQRQVMQHRRHATGAGNGSVIEDGSESHQLPRGYNVSFV